MTSSAGLWPVDPAQPVAVIGGGPAGLMAAEGLSARGHAVTLFEAMPTIGRKFLLAGKSGLNITHAEDYARFRTRFGVAGASLAPALDAFPPQAVRDWADALGIETFVGTSDRVFPLGLKASPLLRAWRARLEASGVRIRTRHRMVGLDRSGLHLATPEGDLLLRPPAVLLALGGASWPRLGSDAGWMSSLAALGVALSPFRPANCGFDVAWSPHFLERFAGAPLKGITATSAAGCLSGECVVSRHGIEGSLVYAHASACRDALEAEGQAELVFDLAPGRSLERLTADLARQSAKASFSTRLRKGAGLEGVKAALLREVTPEAASLSPEGLASRIKHLPVPLLRPRPIAEAISSAGGVRWEGLDERMMVRSVPGLFVAGEMVDWEAPTGGYLLTACLAMGRHAGLGLADWLEEHAPHGSAKPE
ncbi:TIGR03862 family flavoprotein [Xaviernesmea rhizosphaerae]|uniref:TIGR03862 family flavoprotein n=1 Tax=Xaviernesmea rhizosphaerae TaxID=1672749 RepID=UPI0024781B78|nr:TIGR03862 family flavoprotein [Xaviernesmea rhizosphaerae]